MNIDTKEKKPKIYSVAVMSAIAVALFVYFAVSGAEGNNLRISIVVSLYLLAITIRLIAAFFGQLKYNPYSYNTIYYVGFTLFILSVLITFTYITEHLIYHPDDFGTGDFINVLMNSARSYIHLTTPFLLVFSLALWFSNVALMRREGRSLVNLLGILLGTALIVGVLVLRQFEYYEFSEVQQVRIVETVASLCAAIYLYVECMLIGSITASAIVIRKEPKPDRDFMIILGCGLRADGTPTPLLQGRIERALEYRRSQMERSGKDLVFVTSGGQGSNEVISESASMKRYLMQQGIPEGQILEEDRSTDTFENMKYSREKILSMDPDGKVAFSTSSYHVFRSGLCARRVKMRAEGVGASTKWYFWPNAWVREFIGLLTEHRGKQALILGGMIAFFVAMTLFA